MADRTASSVLVPAAVAIGLLVLVALTIDDPLGMIIEVLSLPSGTGKPNLKRSLALKVEASPVGTANVSPG